MPRKLTDAQLEEGRALSEAGVPQVEIARRLGISQAGVSVAHRRGWAWSKRPTGRPAPSMQAQLAWALLVGTGYSPHEIRQTLGIHTTTTKRWLSALAHPGRRPTKE